MRIKYKKHGGFANLKVEREVDTSTLPSEHAEALKKLVGGCGLSKFISPPRPSGRSHVVHYTITIEEGGQIITVEFYDPIPIVLLNLVRHLDKLPQHSSCQPQP